MVVILGNLTVVIEKDVVLKAGFDIAVFMIPPLYTNTLPRPEVNMHELTDGCKQQESTHAYSQMVLAHERL